MLDKTYSGSSLSPTEPTTAFFHLKPLETFLDNFDARKSPETYQLEVDADGRKLNIPPAVLKIGGRVPSMESSIPLTAAYFSSVYADDRFVKDLAYANCVYNRIGISFNTPTATTNPPVGGGPCGPAPASPSSWDPARVTSTTLGLTDKKFYDRYENILHSNSGDLLTTDNNVGYIGNVYQAFNEHVGLPPGSPPSRVTTVMYVRHNEDTTLGAGVWGVTYPLFPPVVSIFQSTATTTSTAPDIQDDVNLTQTFIHELGHVLMGPTPGNFDHDSADRALGHNVLDVEHPHYLQSVPSISREQFRHIYKNLTGPWERTWNQ